MDYPNWKEKCQKFGENVKVQSGNLLHLFKENKTVSVVIVAFIVVVLLAVALLNTKEKQEEVVAIAETSTEAAVEGEEEELVVTEEVLEKDAYPEVNNLVKQYYQALVDGDMETISKIKSFTDEEEQMKIVKKSEFIEGYPSLTVYTKKGPEENSYIAYVHYEVKFYDYEKTAPGLNTLYICMDDAGNYYINSDDLQEDVVEYLKTVSLQNDVLELFNAVQVAYNEVKTGDENLGGFLDELPILLAESVSETIAEQVALEEAMKEEEEEEVPAEVVVVTKVKAKEVVNVRSSDSIEADRLGQTSTGQVLELLEEKVNGWSKVKFDGKEGYIKSEFLEPEETQTVANPQVSDNGTEEASGIQTASEIKTTKGKVTDTVNIRKTASTTGEKLGQLAKGTSVDIIEKQADGWTKIKYNDGEAFVKSDYVE
ncbi:MAG: SH3 domain-containing protein [Lachnospiraceae bacterium]|nr:SH3 domain-containing protein [Lachnospiraceae bacterium]